MLSIERFMKFAPKIGPYSGTGPEETGKPASLLE
jgi:hypothetical protein